MVRVIVERVFAEGVDEEGVRAISRAAADCFRMRNVRAVASWLSHDGKRMICEYEAPDAESVRAANDKANVPYERVWTAHHLLPEGAAKT